VLTYHLRDTGGALATLDLDGDFVGDAQRIGWHFLRCHHLNSATQLRAGGDRSEIANSVGSVVQRVFYDFQPDDIPNERRDQPGAVSIKVARPSADPITANYADDGHRAQAVFDGIRSMFRNDHEARTAVTVNELIGAVLAVVRGELDAHRVSLRRELSDGLPTVLAAPTQLQQVLLNLVMNAIEAMGPVTTQERVLIVKSEIGESGNVQITVEDTGSGIDPSLVDRVFEAFFTTKALGMGMGLSICRSIVEAHGGLLSFSARKPNGSRFCVELPIAPPNPVYSELPERDLM
jgi:signal transduction histidine kinase